MDYVKNEKYINSRILVATNKTEKNFKFILPFQTFYKRMYQLLLEKIFEVQNEVDISHAVIIADRRNTHSEEEMNYICKRLYYNNPNIDFGYVIAESENYQLIQVTDLLIGAISYERKGLKTNTLKLKFIGFLKNTFATKGRLGASTPLSKKKLNVFIWIGEEY